MVEGDEIVALTGFFVAYLACTAGALWLGKGAKQTQGHSARHGRSGEQRLARTLVQAGYTVLTDITLRQGAGTHQIDHVVCGQDRLFVIETKTWRGAVEGRAGDQNWTIRRPRSRNALTVYNPLFQNQTHAEVVGAITRVPVTPLVVSAGFLTVPPDLAEQVLPLPGLPAFLGPPGTPTGRIARAFEELTRRKAAWSQKALAARHTRWMATSRRLDPARAMWVASAVFLACAAIAVQRLAAG